VCQGMRAEPIACVEPLILRALQTTADTWMRMLLRRSLRQRS
jgi:hypothetical protein